MRTARLEPCFGVVKIKGRRRNSGCYSYYNSCHQQSRVDRETIAPTTTDPASVERMIEG
jgi:hypothetical protein